MIAATEYLRKARFGFRNIRVWEQEVRSIFDSKGIGERGRTKVIVVDFGWLRKKDQEWQQIMEQLSDREFNRWCMEQRRIQDKINAVNYKIMNRPRVRAQPKPTRDSGVDNNEFWI